MISDIKARLVEFEKACENGQVNPSLAAQLSKSLARGIHCDPVMDWKERISGVVAAAKSEPEIEQSPVVKKAETVTKAKKTKGRKKKE